MAYTTDNIGSGFSIVNPIIDAPKVILDGQKIFAGWTKENSRIVNYIDSNGGYYSIYSTGEFSYNTNRL